MRRWIGLIACCLAGTLGASPVSDDRGVPLPSGVATRIVTLSPHLAELVHAAGAGDLLVASVAFTDYPDDAARLPVVGDAFRVDLERLAAMDPDVVLGWLGGNPASTLQEVERLGWPLVALHAATLGDIPRHIRLLGALTGRVDSAELAAASFDERLATLTARYSDADTVAVFYQVAQRPLYTVGGGHSLDHAIRLCGGRNVFSGVGILAPSVTVEAVIAAAPKVIVGGTHPSPAEDPGVLAPWRRWTRIPAVRDGHLYQLDSTLMGRPTPRMLDGVEMLCERMNRARQRR